MDREPAPTSRFGTSNSDKKNGACGYLVVYRILTIGPDIAANRHIMGMTNIDEYLTDPRKACRVFSGSEKKLNLEKAGNNVTAIDPVTRPISIVKLTAT